MLHWSRQQFEQDARWLANAMQNIIPALKQEEQANFLLQWTVETATDGSLYLVHPPVSRRHYDTSAALVGTNDNTNNEEDDEDLLCDNEILQDDPGVIASISNGHEDSIPQEEETQHSTVWYFSIVYSDTWQVPVLYFTVDHSKDGSPCTRTQVLELLLPLNNHQIEDSWDFLSHEEHPISRIPSYFLHPCKTLERLQTLFMGGSLPSNNDKEPDTKPKPSNSSGETQHHQMLLLNWMSMNLPSVGYPVPARLFQQLTTTNATVKNDE